MQKTDGELVISYVKGDDGAFTELVKRNTGIIYNFALRILKDKDEAEDIAEETFIKIWKNARKFKTGGNFRAWMFSIARNTAMDFFRKKKAAPFSEFEENYSEENEFFNFLVSEEPLPDEVFSKKENAEKIRKAVAGLPIKYREILSLKNENDFTFEEIAKILGESANTVKSRHRRAILSLKKKMKLDQ